MHEASAIASWRQPKAEIAWRDNIFMPITCLMTARRGGDVVLLHIGNPNASIGKPLRAKIINDRRVYSDNATTR